MGEMAPFWDFEENEMEQLAQKLVCTTLELEKLREEANEEMKMNKEYINRLIRLLELVIQQRDEARIQLFNKTTTTTLNDVVPCLDIPLFSITESNEPSPVDSLFDAVSSPIHINSDHTIDSLAKGLVLPQKGKLVEAVVQAGPLLKHRMMAAPLPNWRNPPPQMHPFQIPPVSIRPDSAQIQNLSAPILNFANLGSGHCGTNSKFMNLDTFSPLAKRQRFG